MVKNNLPSLYGDEAKKFRELAEKGNTRTTSGILSMTSLTSTITYNSTTGEQGIFEQLGIILANYNITAEDLNALAPITGSSTFNSTQGTTIVHNIGHKNYRVSITPTVNPDGYLGEVYTTKNDNTLIVYCSGSDATTTFDYVIYKD